MVRMRTDAQGRGRYRASIRHSKPLGLTIMARRHVRRLFLFEQWVLEIGSGLLLSSLTRRGQPSGGQTDGHPTNNAQDGP